MQRLRHCSAVASWLSLITVVVSLPLSARASDRPLLENIQPIQYRPPTTTVQRREPGSNGLSFGCPSEMPPPVLLMPAGHTGQAIAPHPTFFAFVPAAASVQFVVIEPGSSNTVYGTDFATKTAGIVRLPVPETAPPLKVGKEYWWYVSVLCDPKYARDRSYLQGWVKRVAPNPALEKQLAQAKVGDRPALYAAAGLWYDTLRSLADLRRDYPQEPKLTPIWTDFLKGVGAATVTGMPLVETTVVDHSDTRSPRSGQESAPSANYRPPNTRLPGRNTGGGTR